MLCFPNAKINLGLNIINKRPDGYHNIETVFCPVGLSDMLDFVPEPELHPGSINFTCTGLPLDGPSESNLCVRGYHLLGRDFSLPAIAVHLHKIIPPGSGLGGGSSDAAFMLKQLNLFFELGLSEEKLCEYAAELGSDCAFFIMNRPLFGYERGNLFRELQIFPKNLAVAIINPGIHIATAAAYAGVRPQKPANALWELINLPVEKWKDTIFNDFEDSIIEKHPVIGEVKETLYNTGAVYASMSGSGSSVYGLYHGNAPDMKDKFPEFFTWSGPATAIT